jgi:peptide/nickel transport system permease protein
LWLPAAVLAFVVSALIVKMTRHARRLEFDFVRTTKAIGVPTHQVVRATGCATLHPDPDDDRHRLRHLIAGNVVVEKVFSWAGIGQYAWNALTINDFAVQGFVI